MYKNNDLRTCVDARQANTAVLREGFSLPNMNEALEEMNRAQGCSKLDLRILSDGRGTENINVKTIKYHDSSNEKSEKLTWTVKNLCYSSHQLASHWVN